MSIFHIGRSATAPSTQSVASPWWDWNPARPKPAPAPVEAAPAARWWSWNPYRRTVDRAEAHGRHVGYDKGVRDERRVVQRHRRRGHPVLALLTVATAAFGVAIVGLAFETGSFAAGGAVVDHQVHEWRADLAGRAASAIDGASAPQAASGQAGG